MNPKYKSGRWPHRWLCWFVGEHQFKRSHSLLGWSFCETCGKAARVKVDPFAARIEAARKRAAAGARRMGFAQVNHDKTPPEVA